MSPLIIFLTILPMGFTMSFLNPSYLPVRNLNSALRGYNLFIGSPFSQQLVDPGFRGLLFDSTNMDRFGRFAAHSAIDSTDVEACNADLAATVVTSLKQYRKEELKSSTFGSGFQLGSKTKISAGISAGVDVQIEQEIEPFLQTSSSQSLSATELADFFNKEKGTVVQLTAFCAQERVNLFKFHLPPFRGTLTATVKRMYKAQPHVKEAEFKHFISAFGTHYSVDTILGARLIYSRRYTETERQFSTKSDLIACTKKFSKLSATFVGSYTNEKNGCDKNVGADQGIQSQHVNREELYSIGSKPYRDLDEWLKQSMPSIQPIKMQFVPLVTLFTKENLAKMDPGIDHKIFMSSFGPMFSNICSIMGYGCERNVRLCGIDDDCRFDQQCVQNGPSYTCKGTTTTLHWPMEDGSNYNYKIDVLTHNGDKVFDVVKPQCYLRYCNATIDRLDANTKYLFKVQPVDHSMPQEPVEMGTNDWGIHNLGKALRWYRLSGVKKYIINIINDKTGEILSINKDQCDKTNGYHYNKCRMRMHFDVRSSYVVYVYADVEPKPSFVLQKIVVKDEKWDDYFQ